MKTRQELEAGESDGGKRLVNVLLPGGHWSVVDRGTYETNGEWASWRSVGSEMIVKAEAVVGYRYAEE